MFEEKKEDVIWVKFSMIVSNIIKKENFLAMQYIIIPDTEFFLVK
jgi:hypothetical protein